MPSTLAESGRHCLTKLGGAVARDRLNHAALP